jgi:anaerobic magnesium-protoporphyrin IX monomethyl ester cyclase
MKAKTNDDHRREADRTSLSGGTIVTVAQSGSSRSTLANRDDAGARSVCLVTPPSAFLLDERVFVSLGVLKVAGSLEARGYTVNFLDLSGIENYLQALADYVRTCTDQAMGITATTPQFPAVMSIIRPIRALRPDLKIILGGPHVTLIYSALKLERKRGSIGRAHRAASQLEQNFDVLVSGDGELAIFEALRAEAPKVVDGDDPKGSLFLTDRMFTDGPLPARHLVDLNTYHYTIDGNSATSLVAQLGCPFNCGFCGGRSSNSLRRIRNRSISSILHEIEMLHREYGYTGFMFYDDELNVSRIMVELMNGLADLQSTLGTEFRLRGFIKSELFTEDQAIAMRRAGFRWLLCGFEAANDRILVNINKRATLRDNNRCIELAKRHGLKTKALMSCGHPGESEESIEDIRNWLIQSEVEDFDCTIITTYPGTPYYDLAEPHSHLSNVWTYTHPKTGDRLHAREIDYAVSANYYKGDPDAGYQSFVFTDYLSAEQIVQRRDLIEREVRERLRIPYNADAASRRYEHSMGQGLPPSIHRQSPGRTQLPLGGFQP